MSVPEFVNLFDLERAARERLPCPAWDYLAGGAEDELSIEENRRAFQRVKLRPRVLSGVLAANTTTRVLGQDVSLPVLIAPTTPQRLFHAEAERGMAIAAAAEGSIAVVGTESQFDLPELTALAPGRLWFQLYPYVDRETTTRLIQKAESAGCRALVITVDTVRGARRERNLRNHFTFPTELETPALVGIGLDDDQLADPATRLEYVGSLSPMSLTWADLEWIRAAISIPIVLKGVLRAEDASLAAEHGVDAIIVSNHGGRQLDGTPAPIDVLPEIVQVASGALEILLDGGVRRGTDVIKALALGASVVLIGRPTLWGLTIDGADGVRLVLQMLHCEIENAMVQLGVGRISDIEPGLVRRSTFE
ncbi:MAG: alpha-hydroxy acid oxidase [Nitrolancea sp.]